MKSEYQIAIPADDKGYTQRLCPDCNKKFGIKSIGRGFPDTIYCPYCDKVGDMPDFNMQEQFDYAAEEAKRQIFHDVQKEFQNMFRGVASRSKGNIKYKVSRIRPTPAPRLNQDEIPTDMECSTCKGLYVVYGIASKCPFCGKEDIKILDANLAIIEQELNTDRDLRHLYGDVVTVFERECRYFSRNSKKVKFQNINSVDEHFKKSDVAIFEGVSPQDLMNMRTVFEKRHVDQHKSGLWDQKAIDALGLSRSLIGQKIAYSKDELISAIKALTTVSNNLRSAVVI